MDREKLLRHAAMAVGAVVVLIVGVAAFISLQTPYQPSSSTPVAPACSPQPCAEVRGFLVWVTDLNIKSGLVTMQLTFRNSSAATHVDPADLQLIDSAGHTTNAVHDATGCAAWPRTDFNHGATFGPVPECFRPANTGPPLKLHWAPDLGLLCCETDITLAE